MNRRNKLGTNQTIVMDSQIFNDLPINSYALILEERFLDAFVYNFQKNQIEYDVIEQKLGKF